MENLFFIFMLSTLLVFTSTSVYAQNVSTPRVSAAAEVIQKIGLTTVSVQFSRPQVMVNGNDRTGNIWGGLVSYGFVEDTFATNAMPWWAGANENTVFTTSTDLMIEGEKLAAGDNGLHMAVYEDGKVTVIFSENTSSWGSFHYYGSENVLRVDVQSVEHDFTNTLAYNFIDFAPNSATMVLDWEHKRIPVKIPVDPEQTLVAFRNELRGIKGFSWQGWNSAGSTI
ncbi:MAG TPA: hypothetical protein DDY13_02385 [Cytophagales bacterium]|jgi:hypothetical protein|nr:hypothetical protein [Cytophagales bacterium]